jgi:hypothetical protein
MQIPFKYRKNTINVPAGGARNKFDIP